jgi:hypothetical protein
MSSVWPWIGYLLEFLEADIVTGGTAGRGPKLMDQIDQKSMLFQHFPHTYSSYRFMVTGVGSRPVTQHEHRVLKMITQGACQLLIGFHPVYICRQAKLSEQKMACGMIGSLLSIEGP